MASVEDHKSVNTDSDTSSCTSKPTNQNTDLDLDLSEFKIDETRTIGPFGLMMDFPCEPKKVDKETEEEMLVLMAKASKDADNDEEFMRFLTDVADQLDSEAEVKKQPGNKSCENDNVTRSVAGTSLDLGSLDDLEIEMGTSKEQIDFKNLFSALSQQCKAGGDLNDSIPCKTDLADVVEEKKKPTNSKFCENDTTTSSVLEKSLQDFRIDIGTLKGQLDHTNDLSNVLSQQNTTSEDFGDSASYQTEGLAGLLVGLKKQITPKWLEENTAEKWQEENPELAKEYMKRMQEDSGELH